MFAPTKYIEWARRLYGKVRFDLATSGVPPVAESDVGPGEFTPPSGANAWERLRSAIALHNDTPEHETIAALGTTHALWLALATTTSPGDGVLVEDPAYEPLVRIAEGVGAVVTRFARPPGERFAIDPERIARAMTPRTRVVVLSNLHNPSGMRIDDERLRAAARVAEAGRAVLLVDEVYSAFDDWVDEHGVFRTSARKLAPNVVSVSSLTKCYGLGAERIGWLLGPTDLVARAHDTMTCTAGVLPRSHAEDGLRALANIRGLAERARSILGQKRERVARWAESHGLLYSAPAEGLFGFVTMPERGDLLAAIEAAARDHGVLVAAGVFFGVPNGFRIAWSESDEKLDEGLERLATALHIARG